MIKTTEHYHGQTNAISGLCMMTLRLGRTRWYVEVKRLNPDKAKQFREPKLLYLEYAKEATALKALDTYMARMEAIFAKTGEHWEQDNIKASRLRAEARKLARSPTA